MFNEKIMVRLMVREIRYIWKVILLLRMSVTILELVLKMVSAGIIANVCVL